MNVPTLTSKNNYRDNELSSLSTTDFTSFTYSTIFHSSYYIPDISRGQGRKSIRNIPLEIESKQSEALYLHSGTEIRQIGEELNRLTSLAQTRPMEGV